jgi:hypothetical protein
MCQGAGRSAVESATARSERVSIAITVDGVRGCGRRISVSRYGGNDDSVVVKPISSNRQVTGYFTVLT